MEMLPGASALWENDMGETLSSEKAEVIKVDKVTLKHLKFPLLLPRGSEEEMLRAARNGCNVGDFLIIEGKTYRRIRGGFRLATDEDMAELLAAQLGILEENVSKRIHSGRKNGIREQPRARGRRLEDPVGGVQEAR